MSPLADRVRGLLRQHTPAPLSEREAVQRLRPYGQGVKATLANAPLNDQPPLGCEPGGGLGGLLVDAPDSIP